MELRLLTPMFTVWFLPIWTDAVGTPLMRLTPVTVPETVAVCPFTVVGPETV
jgi:hypothetical protein